MKTHVLVAKFAQIADMDGATMVTAARTDSPPATSKLHESAQKNSKGIGMQSLSLLH